MDTKTLLIIAGAGYFLFAIVNPTLDKWRREAPFRAQQQKRARLEREAAARRAIHEARRAALPYCSELTAQQQAENREFQMAYYSASSPFGSYGTSIAALRSDRLPHPCKVK